MIKRIPICDFGKKLGINGKILTINYSYHGKTYDADDPEQDFLTVDVEE
jgi:hypothetical protein